MRLRKRNAVTGAEVQHYWPSFADMMTTVVLVMVFISVIAFVQSIYDAYETVQIRKEIERIGRVKEEITDVLLLELEKIVGKDQVSRGPNNTITMEGNILFPTASAEISENGKDILKHFSYAFQRLIENEKYREYIYLILIEGHTDKVPYDNWTLSTERAVAVVKEMLAANPTLAQPEYARYLAAAGYSEYHPVALGNRPSDLQQNRRISFQIILDEMKWQEEFIQTIQQ